LTRNRTAPRAAEEDRPGTGRVSRGLTVHGMRIVPLTQAHSEQVLGIYQIGMDTGHATFESEAGTWDSFSSKRIPDHRWAALGEDSDQVLGWVTASAVSPRPVYRGVVEVSVYVRPEAQGRGVGLALLNTFIDSTEAAGIWSIQSGVFPENTASLALHRKAGFRVIGLRERFGEQHGVWRDVVLLERRSKIVG
jgi:L-amino acid N-acyltransferase YncA